MNTTTYLAAIAATGINARRFAFTSTVKPAAAHKHHTLTKEVTLTAMTGVEYAALSANHGAETGDLPWGEWSAFPYIIRHKDADYARLYAVEGSVRARYFKDGVEIPRDAFEALLTPSMRDRARPKGGCITVKMESLRVLL